MTDPLTFTRPEPDPDMDGFRLSDMQDRTYSFGEIAAEIGGEADTLRSWFLSGGLALLPPLDVVAERGGRSHRLHWRTTVLLLLALKLNDYGFSKTQGEAGALAGGAFAVGLAIEHLEQTDGPLIAVTREADHTPRVALIARGAAVADAEAPRILDGFEGIGTLLIDPIALGRVVWRMGWRQATTEARALAAEQAAAETPTFTAEEIAAGITEADLAPCGGCSKNRVLTDWGGVGLCDDCAAGERKAQMAEGFLAPGDEPCVCVTTGNGPEGCGICNETGRRLIRTEASL